MGGVMMGYGEMGILVVLVVETRHCLVSTTKTLEQWNPKSVLTYPQTQEQWNPKPVLIHHKMSDYRNRWSTKTTIEILDHQCFMRTSILSKTSKVKRSRCPEYLLSQAPYQ